VILIIDKICKLISNLFIVSQFNDSCTLKKLFSVQKVCKYFQHLFPWIFKLRAFIVSKKFFSKYLHRFKTFLIEILKMKLLTMTTYCKKLFMLNM